jgi:hypothetical protein
MTISKRDYDKTYREAHREQLRLYFRKYWRQNKERLRERNKGQQARYYALMRSTVLSHYSPTLVCQRCGYSDIRALTIDHINGDGKHRQNQKNSGHHLYRKLQLQNFSPGFQVLCQNCQAVKRCENGESRQWIKPASNHELENNNEIRSRWQHIIAA